MRGGGALSGRSVLVPSLEPDGSPKTVRFSGICDGSGPACSFSVTVEDHGEPGTSDQFGITVIGGLTVPPQGPGKPPAHFIVRVGASHL